MNHRQPIAQAIAIRKNKILKVGTNQEITSVVGELTKIIDLNGKTVIPGLIDTHIHVADFGKCLLWLDLKCANSIKELQTLLKEKAKQISTGQWIIGRGWNPDHFKEKRFLKVSDLDVATPNNPVILYHESIMVCAINTAALKLAKITAQTPMPPGGSADRNPKTGELTGILRDSATNMVWKVVPENSEDELLDATVLACQKIVEAGLTSVHWIILSENEISIIQKLHNRGKLHFRVNVIVPIEFVEKTSGLQSSDRLMLHVGGSLIAVDGYLDSKTAALSKPYSDEPSNIGKLLYSPKSLASSIEQILAMGFQPVLQAMGDKAIDTTLNAAEQAEKQAPNRSIRFRIEQAALLNPQLIERLKTQKMVISVQPKVVATEFSVWSAIQHLGIERAQWLHPLKTLLSVGVKVVGGSDCPMEPLNPLLGIEAAVLREDFPEQRLSAEAALRMYTLDAAYSSGEEEVKGSIEVGKLADLVVLSDNPLAVAVCKIKDINVEMTIVNGKVVYSKHSKN
jgi:predicted amidohydrolase YtcJ